MSEFLDMGGYASFIWPSYAVTFLVLGVLAVTSWRAMRRSEAELKELQDALPRRRRNRSGA
jgi:heme exporter protein D